MSDKVIFKKSTSRPAQRARDVDGDHGGDEQSAADTPLTLVSKLKSKAKRTQPKSRLSFGVDEADEEPSFQIKKSNLSRKVTLGSRPTSLPPNLDQATISTHSNGAPVYDQAHLSELRASTYSTRPAPNDACDVDAPMIVDEGTTEISDIEETTEAVIPSLSRIVAAKERRERLRAGTVEQDYISLTVTKRADIPQGPHPESRLVREEDEIGEGDDEYAEYTSAQERIALGKKARKVEASKRRDNMKEMIAEGVEEDEETLEWEREQLRRGGHDPDRSSEPILSKQIYKAAQIPPGADIPVLGPAIARFQRSLASLSDSHASSTSAMTSLAEQRAELDTRETELRSMITDAESKRGWFAEFRDWVESVATFLDEKFPTLEKLEEEHLSVLKERAEMISQRRRADDADDLSVVFGIPSEPSVELDKADELHRILPASNSTILRRERRAARVARRTRRHARRVPSDADSREEGFSTDSSLTQSDALAYEQALNRIAADGKDILSDVRSIEFKDPNRGLAKWFGEWRDHYADSYVGAWGGLGLVGAWEFWVRLEILGWNPFESQRSLDQFAWYASLYRYSRPPDRNEKSDEPELGPDGDLVSAMISTAVAPRLCKVLEAGALDPYSAKDVRRMIDLAEQVEASVGTDNNKFQMILKSAHAVFDRATSNVWRLLTPFVKSNHPPFDPEAAPARQRLLSRSVKLLENMLRWRKYVADKHVVGTLCVRLVNDCILPIAESGWEVGGERKVRQVLAILPQELASSIRATLAAFT